MNYALAFLLPVKHKLGIFIIYGSIVHCSSSYVIEIK